MIPTLEEKDIFFMRKLETVEKHESCFDEQRSDRQESLKKITNKSILSILNTLSIR